MTVLLKLELQPFVTVYVTVTVPAVRPVTTPPAVILAVPDTGTTDQVPPPVASVKAGVIEPTQTLAAPPPITDTVGKAFTVKDCVAEPEPQIFVTVYVTVTVPAVRPVTTPPAVILAVPVTGTTDQTPPPVASVKAGVVEPTQTLAVPPPIADTDGGGLTTCVLLAVAVPHDPPLVVSVNVAVPLYPPGGVHVAFNVVAFGVNVPNAGVDHVPPVAEPPTEPPNDADVPPWHIATRAVPALAVGKSFIVKDCVAEPEPQIFVTVYVTVTVPAVRPVTTPPAVILAVPVTGTTDQTPPPVASVKAGVVEPTQTLAVPPPIADTDGGGLTTCVLLAVAVPHDPPLVVSVNVAVPLYPPGGVHVAFNVVAFGVNVPNAGVDHVPPVAEPPTEPPNDADVPPWHMATRAEPALAVGKAFTVNDCVADTGATTICNCICNSNRPGCKASYYSPCGYTCCTGYRDY
jgi:hypothetical protein